MSESPGPTVWRYFPGHGERPRCFMNRKPCSNACRFASDCRIPGPVAMPGGE
jgi:hypothetical protein